MFPKYMKEMPEVVFLYVISLLLKLYLKQFICRKRKASSPLESSYGPVITKSFLVNIGQRSKDILQDMGLDYLSHTSTDSCSSTENFTPAIHGKDENSQSSSASFHLPPVPGVIVFSLFLHLNSLFHNNLSLLSTMFCSWNENHKKIILGY